MNKSSRRIILTGFMGAGKTTVAAELAHKLGCRMIDLDEFITAREGRSISDIIDRDGEAQFRERETGALQTALKENLARVIALGGGTWTIEKNRALIKSSDCLTVWLDAPFELCWQRIERESNPRPLARDKESTQQLYQQRQPSYALALLHLKVNGKSPQRLATEIIKALAEEEH
jgi:shikimate kinase